MAGLNARKVGSSDELDSDPFINSYPDDFKGQGDIMAGLLIDAELDRKGINAEDRASIEREMVKLVDPTSATRLNSEGNKLLNLYAAAGFSILQDKMMPPSTIEEFLVAYHGFWHVDVSDASSGPGSAQSA
jgi:pyridoxal/pyridoxine/pyridoxamine kinase